MARLLITIVTPFITLVLIAFLASPTTASTSDITPDVILRRRIKRTSNLLRQRAPIFTLQRRDPVDFDRAPGWATKLPGDFSNSVGRKTDLGSEYSGCLTNGTSPTYPDTLAAAMELENRGDQICVPPQGLGNQEEHHCTALVDSGTVCIYFCGAPGKDVKCSDISDAVLAFNPVCVVRDGQTFRERGSIAILPPGYPEDTSHLSFIVIDSPGLLENV